MGVGMSFKRWATVCNAVGETVLLESNSSRMARDWTSAVGSTGSLISS